MHAHATAASADRLATDRTADRTAPRPHAATALRATGIAWFALAALGQLLFAAYVLGFYGRLALQGRPQDWDRVLPHGYVAGDAWFNLVLAVHLLFAVAVIAGGLLQFVPRIRRAAPAFHRWNGRAYLLLCAVLALGGLDMVWVRGGVVGDVWQHLGISLDALLILGFAGAAWRCARARRIDAHRRWALRLFLAVSGVWFFRVGLMGWLVVNGGPAGFDPDRFTGPTLTVLSFAQTLLPLGVLQLYLHAQRRDSPRLRLAVAAGLAGLTLLMLLGIGAATAFMWLPQMAKA
ncbi:DUF2306 domain-containing protein [Fulvimonas sp. R45]|uniref:DUF2306 domain-containing protein n=1 Tax=Fulvimonas sp. R45 TaxID=3045937 RepID=UPI00265E97BE|nr:DUF2306 domain-containing protein [Fulvimonas sp. R45]MDO1529657.1 DUF2306 domain-containing protein [Fulvimonas sp. R45]